MFEPRRTILREINGNIFFTAIDFLKIQTHGSFFITLFICNFRHVEILKEVNETATFLRNDVFRRGCTTL